MNAADIVNADARREIERAIADVETRTSAEIVCAVATESGRYDRAESVVGLAVAIMFLAIADVSVGTRVDADWSSGEGIMLGVQAAAVAAGFVLGSWLASALHPLRRVFISAREIEEEVTRAAAHVFGLSSVGMTSGQTGVLVYVSLFERRVVILADRSSFEVLGAAGVNELRDAALDKLRHGDVAGAFIATVRNAGERLQSRLPANAASNPDEIPNQVLVYPGRP